MAKKSRSKPVPVVEPKPVTPEGPPVASVWYAVAGVAALIPCFWQSRLQAGDLSSHIYNAWLAQQVAQGKTPGLAVVRQTTNVLFDLMLSAMLPLGLAAAQRIAVAICAAVFLVGAFLFVRKVAGRFRLDVLPFLLPVVYGWVFHIGFFNFYLSLGLCFAFLAFAWDLSRRAVWAIPLLVIAYTAHALPVAWTVGVLVFVWLMRRLGPAGWWTAIGIAVAGIVAVRVVLSVGFDGMWMPQQFLAITGLDQVWIFDEKYFYLMLAFVGVSALRVIHAFRAGPAEKVRPLLLLCLLCAAGVVILPARVQLPGYQHALAFIAERMSLPLAVCLVAVMGMVPGRPVERYASVALALVFFGFVYRDERVLNALEDRVQRMITQTPQGQRVISGVSAPMLRVDPVGHMVDRACTGHCYSYANYEPSTAQFRIRVKGPNPAVASTYLDSWQMQSGGYIVKDADLPLDQLIMDDRGRMAIQQLVAGQQVGMNYWNPLEN